MGALAQKVIGAGITGATAAGSAMVTVQAPYDFQASTYPVINTNATITLPAILGKKWLVSMIVGSIQAKAVTAGLSGMFVIDNGTIVFQVELGVPGVLGTTDRLALSGLAFISAIVNTAMVIQVNAGGANIQSTVNVGAYLI